MSSSPENRRKHPRLPIHVSAFLYRKTKPEECIEAKILDLSLGGAFVNCTTPILLGDEILLEIRFDDTQLFEARVILEGDKKLPPSSKLSQQAVVRWARGSSSSGFGVEFTGLTDEHREFLAKLLQHLERKSTETKAIRKS